MKHIQDDSGPRQTFTIGEGVYEINVSATPRQLFLIFQQAWNMRECVRLLTPGVSERQFTIDDQRWIKDANNSLDDMFRSVGLKLQRARELFAPDNCPDLIVPHVVFETEPTKPTKPTAPIHRERDDIFDDYSGQDNPNQGTPADPNWLSNLCELAWSDLHYLYVTTTEAQIRATIAMYKKAFGVLTQTQMQVLTMVLKPNERWWRALQADLFGPQLGR